MSPVVSLPLAPLTLAASLRAGGRLVLVETGDEGVLGHLVTAAEHADAAAINTLAREARGLVCLPLAAEIVDRLRLPLLPQTNRRRIGTAYTVSIEARAGVSTGISAQDRAVTIAAAIRPGARPEDLATPGHVFPIRVEPQDLDPPRSAAAAAVALCRDAGLIPAAVICAIMTPDGAMAGPEALAAFAADRGLPLAYLHEIRAAGR